tara:strand:+ start:106 stop:423 length:318 start_codon:yes stop_codon:yes gene_type:complete
MNIIKKLCCCDIKNNVYFEMHQYNYSIKEKEIIKFLEKNNINNYVIDSDTDILPCKLEYLFNKIKEDISDCLPDKINILIRKNHINISYDNNPFRDSSIFFNNFD